MKRRLCQENTRLRGAGGLRASVGIAVLCALLWGCASAPAPVAEEPAYIEREERVAVQPAPAKKSGRASGRQDRRLTERVITEQEITKISEKHPEITPVDCYEILARLNAKARYYIPEDIRHKRKLKVPNDFSLYRNWTPLPRHIPAVSKVSKLIVIVKDIPFIGWYAKGKLIGDTQICIGKQADWTKSGLFKVEEKDPDHISGSYTNAFGDPAPMPLAMRIYGRVWIHMGDVVGGYASHGCVNLSKVPAERLYAWADVGTPVLVIDSLKDMDGSLQKYAKLLPTQAEKPVKSSGMQGESSSEKSLYY